MAQTSKLVASALIIQDGTILLVQNQKNPKKGCFGFPGGVIKMANPIKALEDMVLTDTGCGFTGEFFTYNYREEEFPVATLFFAGTVKGKPRSAGVNIVDAKFFTIEEAQKMDLAHDHNMILEQYLKTHWTV